MTEYEREIGWNQRRRREFRERTGEPWRQLRRCRAALAASLLLNFALAVCLFLALRR